MSRRGGPRPNLKVPVVIEFIFVFVLPYALVSGLALLALKDS